MTSGDDCAFLVGLYRRMCAELGIECAASPDAVARMAITVFTEFKRHPIPPQATLEGTPEPPKVDPPLTHEEDIRLQQFKQRIHNGNAMAFWQILEYLKEEKLIPAKAQRIEDCLAFMSPPQKRFVLKLEGI